MALIDLWKESPDQLEDKQVHQLIAFAGKGKLKDGSQCSWEFRTFLDRVPSSALVGYSEQCLQQSFNDSGLALQDIVNQIGSRLGAVVDPGRYRASGKEVGYDGLWFFSDGHAIIIEVKTTDAYRIDLNTIANYRKSLIENGRITEAKSSMLLIVGRQDTGDLEAQIRGSRYAWDLRIISIEPLIRLMKIKEDVEDPQIIERIHSILKPKEFTRLDEIADILFSAAEDIKQDAISDENGVSNKTTPVKEKKFTPVAFHDACVKKVELYLGQSLIKRSRAKYSTPDNSILINCAVSKEHDPDINPSYWFAFHPHQKEYLEQSVNSYIILGCGSSKHVLLIPYPNFVECLDGLWTTVMEDRWYWHIRIVRNDTSFILRTKKDEKNIEVSEHLVPNRL